MKALQRAGRLLHGNRFLSIIITLAVIVTLLIAGPAFAVTVAFGTPDNNAPHVGEEVNVGVTVTVEIDENIPVRTVTLFVNGVECEFPVEGGSTLSEDEICQGFTLTRGDYVYEQEWRWGYGYGYPYGWDDRTFGYGYGYGYGPVALAYGVNWVTDEYEPGLYTFHFSANARGDGRYSRSHFRYITEDPLLIELLGERDGGGNNGGGGSSGGGTSVTDCREGYEEVDGRCVPVEDDDTGDDGDDGSDSGDDGSNTQSDGTGGNTQTGGGSGDDVPEEPDEAPEDDNLITGDVTGAAVGGGAMGSLLWLWILLGLVVLIGGVWYWLKK